METTWLRRRLFLVSPSSQWWLHVETLTPQKSANLLQFCLPTTSDVSESLADLLQSAAGQVFSLPRCSMLSWRPMTVPFATVADARKLTGKSESTIKRLVREIVADPEHPDRREIEPSHEQVERLRAAGEPYVWRISTELLLRRFPLKERREPSGTVPAAAGPQSADLVVQVLQEQLRSKDEQFRSLEKQLDRKDEQIANLNERQRETNILMKELQQRLALAPPAAKTFSDAAPVEPSSKTAPRPGILRRLLGR